MDEGGSHVRRDSALPRRGSRSGSSRGVEWKLAYDGPRTRCVDLNLAVKLPAHGYLRGPSSRKGSHDGALGRRGMGENVGVAAGAAGASAPLAERRRPALRTLAVAMLLLAADASYDPAAAERGPRVAQQTQARITVPSTIAAEPASQTVLPIEVGPAGAPPPNSFVRLRGLPGSVSLTVGHAVAAGAWAVPLFGLATLKANIPTDVSGRSEITVSLMSIDGVLLAQARTALVVRPAAAPEPSGASRSPAVEPKRADMPPPPPPVPAARPQRGGQPTAPPLTGEARARAEHMLAQGERYLEQGNITPARQFFRRAAEAGLAQAAIRLATTYDPAELRRFKAQGLVPDLAEARKWYERARELGADEAEERLSRLGSGS